MKRLSFHGPLCLRRLPAALLAAALLLGAGMARAQSITGASGLIFTPVAGAPPDGTVALGGGYVGGKHSWYGGTPSDTPVSYYTYYGSITFLPFAELGFRFSRANSGVPEALGDRMFLMRFTLLREGRRRPALAVGAHDFLRSSENQTANFTAVYAVASKRLGRLGPLGPARLHAGVAPRLLDAKNYQYKGPFGGIEISPSPYADVLLEHDSRVPSAGLRLKLPLGVRVMGALHGLDAFAWGASVQRVL